eukprot:CAMPEP_0116119086 /NCGR_PEP_ID=MMETSP0329-20121206/2451_1 /TAXON_ID=697910 /ORGANISM="Pseudo-nitzschia arenysensis, Strain B593" /LENGTH=695 /DNA_ID=CAMNT_0003612759 /DNA_START=589 /DNA_END=2676 /DNA_ORIENTATION=+
MNQYRRTATAPVLPIAPSPIAVTGHKRKLVGNGNAVAIPRRDTSPAQLAPVAEPPKPAVVTKPSDYWNSLLDEWNVPILDTVGIEQDESPDKQVEFLETTSDRVEAYQNIELLTAVRRRDMVTLKRIASDKLARGGTMNACNRFGESILHLACRKGSLDVVELLVGSDCNCSLLVRDDYGRTVLHDACWTVSPPWELLKLILKKAPVLWRVSDIRGHLAMQYIPKSAWPQWAAFLSKNKGLLQRIMVHSYHHIDIMQQQVPQAQTQHQQGQIVKQETGVTQDSSMNDANAVPAQNLPQHQQSVQQQTIPQQQQHIPMPLPTPASRPVSAHNSQEHLQSTPQVQPQNTVPAVAARATPIAKPSEPAQKLATTPMQAQDLLARALAQANPAMVQAISQGQQGPLKQGLSRYTPTTVAPTATQAMKVEPATQEEPTTALAPAPGPATAALDEALRAQSANRSKSRSNLLLTEQHPHKEPSKPQIQAEEKPLVQDRNEAQAPLPYAPSISMIAARLKGYQKSSAAAAREEAQTSAAVAHQESSQEQLPINPLPAVPNPLLGILSEGESSATVKSEEKPENPPPAQLVAARHQEQDSDGGNSNHNSISVSSVTMSVSPSFVEENGSDTTLNNTTDTDSDRAVTSSSSNPEPEDTSGGSKVATAAEAPMDIEGDTPANAGQNNDDSSNKPSLTGSEKIIVG